MPSKITVTALVHIAAPRLTTLDDGVTKVCNISGAATFKDRRGNEWTTWVQASFWGKRGEAAAEHLSKGDLVEIVGYVKRIRLYERNNTPDDASLEEEIGATLELQALDITYIKVQKWGHGGADDDEDFDETDVYPF